MSQLSKLFVKKLIFSGIHGATGREKHDPQRFEVNITIDLDISKSAKSDRLEDTYDYKNAIQIAKSIIEDQSNVLIEKIATSIAEGICCDPKVTSASVTLHKLDASRNGVPGITVTHKRSPQEMV